MPALDTEVLFALRTKDRLHLVARRRLTQLANENARLMAPDSAVYEYYTVVRSLGKPPSDARAVLLALAQKLKTYRVEEKSTFSIGILALQSKLEGQYGLTYFDSLIAASALSLDSIIVSDDTAFDRVPGLQRISLS